MKANKVSNELYSSREVKKKLRFLTLRVLLLQNKASKLATNFLDHLVHQNILSKFKNRFLLYQKAKDT